MRIGIDLGGTKIEGVLLDDTGHIANRIRIPTPSNDYRETVNKITMLVAELESGVERTDKQISVGVGTPGAISQSSGLIKNSNNTCLNGSSLRQDLAEALQRNVQIANDADCFTLSESVDGAADNVDLVFGVILGTGVGGGITVNKSLIRGANSIAGEWGHNPLPLTDREFGSVADLSRKRLCGCGKVNCIESWLSGPGFQSSYFEVSGTNLSAEEIMLRVNQGEQLANALLAQYCRMLALALSMVINIIDPAIIVLGGGMSNIEYIYEQVPELWHDYIFSDSIETRLVKARYGDSSGVRGAAWL